MDDNKFFSSANEPMIEMFIFETSNLIEQLEEILINAEKRGSLTEDDINEIFRIMHTIKGSAAMMMFSNISKMAHSIEDLFYYIRENKGVQIELSTLLDKILEALDFIKTEINKIREGHEADGDENKLVAGMKDYLALISGNPDIEIKRESSSKKKQQFYISPYNIIKDENANNFEIKITYEDNAQMENIRSYTIVHNLKAVCNEIISNPENLIESNDSSKYIIENGLTLYLTTKENEDKLKEVIEQEIFIKTLDIKKVEAFEGNLENSKDEKLVVENKVCIPETNTQEKEISNMKQNIISVNINKLDKLMDMVGEIVITESMVIKNKDLAGLNLDNFNKAARQLRKLTDELQDIVMTIRLVPVAMVFSKMHRIVRDMSRKLDKEVDLEIIGDDTEVDKNIIDHLSDPLMHLIRNCMDHGIESKEERIKKGKDVKGKITLEAKNASGEVIIRVKDDGKGLDKEKIIKRAIENGLINKDSELTEKEIFGLIFLPGFSTKDEVTEYSGRGVGMDVVKKDLEKVGGTVYVESTIGIGTTVNIKIPLTLAIVDGMEIAVGKSIYTVPTTSIKESFKLDKRDLVVDTSGNEMVMVRGNCYPILRLHKLFGVETEKVNIEDGIIVMVEADDRIICLYADALLGEQQVVVKPLPSYLLRFITKESGVAGCTILGDGNISLILDVSGLINRLL